MATVKVSMRVMSVTAALPTYMKPTLVSKMSVAIKAMV